MSEIKTIFRQKLLEEEEIHLSSGEKLNFVFVVDPESDIKSHLKFVLKEDNSEVTVLGFNLRNKGDVNVTVDVDHCGHNTKGKVVIKSVLGGSARAKVNGLIKTYQKATLTDGAFDHKVLLLSNKANVNTSPSLEIEDNQVQVSHGATISNLEEEDLFYLCAKGLDKSEAENLLVSGFIVDSLKYMEENEKRSEVKKVLQGCLKKYYER